MKNGLVLEGGAMRGLFTCGIMDVLLENNIEFDGAIGVSAGCVFGCNYKSKQIGRPYRYNRKYCNDPRYSSFKSLLQTGNFYNTEFCYYELPEQLDPFDTETFQQNPMKFYGVATNVVTGKAIYHECKKGDQRDVEYMRASASMPFVSQIVNIEGYKLLDGGIADSIPLVQFEKMGYDHNLVILTQPRDFQKEPNKFILAAKILYQKYPKFIEALATRHIRYNETLEYIKKQEATGNCLVLAPKKPLNISHTCSNPLELDRVYQSGKEVGLENLEAIKSFLMKK